MGLALADLTAEQKKELDITSGVVVEDITGAVRGNVRPGDVILAIVTRGQSTDAKTAEQIDALLSKVDKGAPVTLRLKRGEQEYFSTLSIDNSE